MGAGVGRHRLAPAAPEVADAIHARARVAARVAGLILMIGFAATFARQLIAFRDPFVPISEDVDLLLSTDWGTAWRWASALAVAAVVSFALAGPGRGLRRVSWEIGLAAVVALGVFPALSGHAASGDPRWLSQTASVAHVWGAGLWIGGLGMLVATLGLARSTLTGDGSTVHRLTLAFSPVALAGVALLLPSGSIASLQHLEGPTDLWTTAWGRWLSVKLLVVLGVLALGAWNWRVATARTAADSGPDRASAASRLRRTASVELVLAHLALLATALLTRTNPG